MRPEEMKTWIYIVLAGGAVVASAYGVALANFVTKNEFDATLKTHEVEKVYIKESVDRIEKKLDRLIERR